MIIEQKTKLNEFLDKKQSLTDLLNRSIKLHLIDPCDKTINLVLDIQKDICTIEHNIKDIEKSISLLYFVKDYKETK